MFDDAHPALTRLTTLLCADYRVVPHLLRAGSDVVVLRHPAETRTEQYVVTLYASGLMVGRKSGRDVEPLRIEAADAAGFEAFIRAVPRANAWEKVRPAVLHTIVFAMLLGGGTLIGLAVQALWHWIRRQA